MNKVLVVEDEGIVALLLEGMLADLGYEVVAIEARLDRALAQARATDADFAILDVNLDGTRSYDVAAVLRDRSIPVIFATACGPSGLDEHWRSCSVLEKPFGKTALQIAIHNALNHRAPHEDSDRMGTR